MPEMADPEQYESFADAVGGLPGVLDADVFDRDPRVNRPLVEVVVGPAYERVPPRVCRCIAEHDLGLRNSAPKPDGHFIVEVI